MFAAGCGRSPEPTLAQPLPEHPNLIVFLSDTLRADHLPCYGYKTATAPHISEFAKGAYVFEECRAAATWTLPSTATVLTGSHPIVHRMAVSEWTETQKDRGFQHQVLSESIPSTAQHLRTRGYQSGYFQSNPNAARERGIARGFDRYYYELSARPGEQMDAALDWLAKEAKEPFYAYLHFIDPHEPYAPDGEAFLRVHGMNILESIAKLPNAEANRLRDYHEIDWADFYIKSRKITAEELKNFSPRSIGHLMRLYDGEIFRVDEAFGRLWTWLNESGIGRRTVTVVTSDHGEAFGEDGQFYHGSCLHDAQTHVPLIVGLPASRGGARVPWTVSQCDIHSTLLGLAGIATDAPASGAMLLNRNGSLSHRYHRPALSALDRFNSDPKNWAYCLAWGHVRVKSMPDFGSVEVSSGNGAEEPIVVKLEDAQQNSDDEIIRLVQRFYLTCQQLGNMAATIPEPTWRQTEEFDEATFRALGYL